MQFPAPGPEGIGYSSATPRTRFRKRVLRIWGMSKGDSVRVNRAFVSISNSGEEPQMEIFCLIYYDNHKSVTQIVAIIPSGKYPLILQGGPGWTVVCPGEGAWLLVEGDTRNLPNSCNPCPPRPTVIGWEPPPRMLLIDYGVTSWKKTMATKLIRRKHVEDHAVFDS